MKSLNFKFFACLAILAIPLFFASLNASASLVDDLKAKISENNVQIEAIQKEIEELQKQLDKTGQDAKTLNNQISQLETTVKKLKTDIKLTERKISQASLVIEELNVGIKDKEEAISENKKTMAEIIRNMDEAESTSLIEVLLANSNFSDFFGDIDRMKDFQNNININLAQLKELKTSLQNQEAEKEAEKKKLQNLQSSLTDKKSITEVQKSQKNVILKETKNKESEYKKLLADRLAKQQALENEIRAIEEQIRVEIDPSSLPKTGTGVLSWPVDNPVITQYFGNTPFATQNPQVYGGNGHNGIDLRASIGTPIKSAQLGVVIDTGNTDLSCRGVSYGKWVLIRHENNLSTLYAHFSLIKVTPGEKVEIGQIIGYSGDSGYVTGPHLHFAVFASPAVEIGTVKSRICGTTIRLPIAPYNAYLNPLSYL